MPVFIIRKMKRRKFVVCVAILAIPILAYPLSSLSQSQRTNAGCPKLPGNPSDWKDQEHWVWNEVCAGRTADLGRPYPSPEGPEHVEGWPVQRDLSQSFLETILFKDSYRSIIPRQGVAIAGARFREPISLLNGKLGLDFTVSGSRFDRTLSMRGLETTGSLSLLGSYFGAQQDDAIDLAGAKISGALDLDGIKASRNLNMEGLKAGALSMRGARLTVSGGYPRSIWLQNAKIEGELDMSDARFDGELQMNNLNVGNNLKLLQSTVTRVLLQSAKIGGILDIEGPNRHRAADPNPPPPRPKNYPAQFVDLSGAAVGTLSLGSSWYGPVDAPANWGAGARLTLTNASVNTLVDGLCANSGPNCVADTWPEHLDLTGFTFQQFLDRDAGKEVDAADRSISWWTKWLGRQERYSPQAYEYIASMFLKLGYKDRAEDILYASKNRELGNTPFPGNIKLWLERVLIGYGYRTRYAVLWVAGFIILGAGMLRLSGEGLRNKMPYGAAFSFDMLLPIVRLRDYHYRVELNGWVRYYFYFHKLMGYLLASFLIAGLSGLTK